MKKKKKQPTKKPVKKRKEKRHLNGYYLPGDGTIRKLYISASGESLDYENEK